MLLEDLRAQTKDRKQLSEQTTENGSLWNGDTLRLVLDGLDARITSNSNLIIHSLRNAKLMNKQLSFDNVGCVELKVLVTGSYNAGKSSFINRVTRGTSFSIDRAGTTVAMDHGVTSAFGVMVHLFGTPGLRRFNVLRKILARGADGVIFMLDSTNPSSFEEGGAIYEEVKSYLPKAPMIFCVNKQDLKDALSPEALRKQLSFTKDLIMIGTSAVTGVGVDEVIKIIVLAILRRLQGTLRTVDRVGKNGLSDIAKTLGEDEAETRHLLQWLSWRRLLIADWDRMQFSLSPRIREIVDIFEIIEKRKILERSKG